MFSRSGKILLLAVLAVVVISVVLCPLLAGEALARAGGGERFPGMGGGGSGGGGDDGFIFYIIMWIIFNPYIPWPIKIVVIIAVLAGGGYVFKRKRSFAGTSSGGGAYQASSAPLTTGSAYIPAQQRNALGDQLTDLKSRDPDFSEQSFEDMASTAFYKIQEAWSKKDLAMARKFTSPSLLQRFQVQIDEMKKNRRTNKIEGLTVGAVQIVEAFHDANYDYVTAKIDAASADYTVDDQTGNLVSGSKDIRRFSEYWTFLRSDQVKTGQSKNQVESEHCPNCGAPIDINAHGKCEYCGSDVTSGRFSWVLSEITQASVWTPRVSSARPQNVSPLAGERYVLGIVQCPNCGANVQDVHGITNERCWRCGNTVLTAQ